MRTRRVRGLFPAVALLVCLAACGDSSPGQSDDELSDASGTSEATSDSPAAAAPSDEPPVPDATAETLGVAGLFGSGGGGAPPLDAQADGRECLLADALLGSCRASTGAGGAFVVTAESTVDAPTVWNVVVRCGTSPAVPAASAQGDFQPIFADLGLEPYGEVLGVTLIGDAAEAALVYQPEGARCPVVWGLGEVDKSSLFTGGLDALSGEANPIRFTDGRGVDSCAIADADGGISVSPCS